MASSSLRSQRRFFCLFVLVSLALHLVVGGAMVLPDLIEKSKEEKRMAAAMEQRLQAEKVRQILLDEIAAHARNEALAFLEKQTGAKTTVELKQQFQGVIADAVPPADAGRMWDELVPRLTGAVNDYARLSISANIDKAQLDKAMHHLQAKMLQGAADGLRRQSANKRADAFIALAQQDVAPKLGDYYRKELAARVGPPLRDAGMRIAHEELLDVRGRRLAMGQALAEAERNARTASLELAASKKRIEAVIKYADALRKKDKGEIADKKLADAIHVEQAEIEKASAGIEQAGVKLREAGERAEGLTGDGSRAIRVAAEGVDPATKNAARTREQAQAGKGNELAVSVGDSAVAAAKLADAIKVVHEGMGKGTADSMVEAHLALKHARDEEIRPLIDKSFKEAFAARAAPRMADKLSRLFREKIEHEGITDGALVADINQRLKTALIDGMGNNAEAGQGATAALTKIERLDEVAEPAPARPKADPAHNADMNAPAPVRSAREKAMISEMSEEAREIIHSEIQDFGDEAGGDDLALAGLVSKRTLHHGKAIADGEPGESDSLTDIADRIARLAEDVKTGRRSIGITPTR